MTRHRRLTAFALLLATLGFALADVVIADDLRVLPAKVDGVEPRDMLQQHLRGKVTAAFEKWQADYEKRTDPAAIAAHYKQLRQHFVEAIGGLPQRTPLNGRVVETIKRDGYTIDKIIFESQPRHYVTGLLYVPDAERFKPPYAGVLVPCGHSTNGKAADAYQKAPALLALNGIVGFCFDPIGQGERMQLLDDAGKPRLHGTREHTNVGIGAILLGQNTARFEIWDGMRAIDYLQSRDEVDPERIGCMGVSGGGTQTSYLMALDERIKVAAPACYITNFHRLIHTLGPQDAEQNIFGQLAFGMDHADYIHMRAPKPTLICAATHDFFDIEGTWTSYRYATRLYTRLGHGRRLSIVENDAKHNYNADLREASVRWMLRWLDDRDVSITEPEIATLSDKQIHCTPGGQVMLIEGARSVYDLNIATEKAFAEKRRAFWEQNDRAAALRRVREISGVRALEEIPQPKVDRGETLKRDGYTIEKVILKRDENVLLPALLYRPAKADAQPGVVFVHQNGKSQAGGGGGAIEALVKAGRTVLAVDVRDVGEIKSRSTFKDVFTAYLLGESIVALRAEDMLVAARWLAKHDGHEGDAVELHATGDVGVAALHAGALERELFTRVQLSSMLISWASLIHEKHVPEHLVNIVHGALTTYDLPDLAKSLGDRLRWKD